MPDKGSDDEQIEPELEITDLRPRRVRMPYAARHPVRFNSRIFGWVALVVSGAFLLAVLLSALPVLRTTLGQLVVASTTPTVVSEISVSGISVIPPFSTAVLPTSLPIAAVAPTPTDVPAGWTVLAGWHFSMAYPPGWSLQSDVLATGPTYNLEPPNPHDQGVEVDVALLPPYASSVDTGPYCLSSNHGIHQTTFAGLPMAYEITGEGVYTRTWTFVNSQHTEYMLKALDEQGTAAAQGLDDSILATFRPDGSTRWHC
jgi:hypothetical protein